MTRIFRRLRIEFFYKRNLKRYFVYGLGEILLVMIGILLALKVNNWNNKRIIKKVKKAYLVELQREAESDLKKLEKDISRAENYVIKVDDLYFKKKEITKEDLDAIGIIRQTFFINNAVYDEIVSNGQLKLIPEDVKIALMDLHSIFKKINKIDEKSVDLVNSHHLKIGDFFEIRRLHNLHQYKIISTDLSDEKKSMLVYKNYINATYDWMKTQTFFYKKIKVRYKHLIKLIQNT